MQGYLERASYYVMSSDVRSRNYCRRRFCITNGLGLIQKEQVLSSTVHTMADQMLATSALPILRIYLLHWMVPDSQYCLQARLRMQYDAEAPATPCFLTPSLRVRQLIKKDRKILRQ